MNRPHDPLSHLPDWEALLHDRKRFLNRLVWSVVLSPPVSRQHAGVQRPEDAAGQPADLPTTATSPSAQEE